MSGRFRSSSCRLRLTFAVLFMFATTVAVYAAQTIPVLECCVSGDTLVMYLQRKGDPVVATAQIDSQTAELRAGEESAKTITWVLYDNSYSIPYADQTLAKDILGRYLRGKTENELVNLCTFDEHLVTLFQESGDGNTLANALSAVRHNDQETYLTDVLKEVLDKEAERNDGKFVRILVFSDGVDNNPKGITREELVQNLKESNIPIYTIGCGGDSQSLKEMYALSRQTGGQSWDLTEIDPEWFHSVMGYDLMPQRAVVKVPAVVQDGMRKVIRITFPDGSVAETEAKMPFHVTPSQPEPEPDPVQDPIQDPTPNPIEIEPEKTPFPVGLIVFPLLLILLAAGGVAAYFLIRRRQKEEEFKTTGENFVERSPAKSNKTDILDRPTFPESDQSHETEILVSNDIGRQLNVTDQANQRVFSESLRDAVTIGRNQSNRIVLDYDNTVSGRHCEIYQSGGDFWIRDLNSSNGTYVNDVKITDASPIQNPCMIRLGRLTLQVSIR